MAADPERLVAVGLSHHTAPVEVRERMAMDVGEVQDFLGRLRADGLADEAMVLSTCNRVELYTVSSDPDHLSRMFPGDVARYLYWHRGRDAVRHLFRVAASLDSLVVGEPQILGQVKQAIRIAEERATLGKVLHPLAMRTMKVAKQVRTETEIGRSRVGVGNAGVDLALQVFGGLEGKRAMLVGVGEMGRQVARALLSSGLEELLVTNRTLTNAQALATAHGGTAIPWERLDAYLPRSDIVVVASGARAPVITTAMISRALRARRWQSLFLIDLSVPRNIAPAVGELEDAYLFNIDDLSRVVDDGREARAEAASEADALVEREADRFLQTLHARDLGTEIGRISQRMEAIRSAELARSRKLVASLDDEQRAGLDALTRSLVKKILHGPLNAMREAGREADGATIDLLKRLWDDEK